MTRIPKYCVDHTLPELIRDARDYFPREEYPVKRDHLRYALQILRDERVLDALRDLEAKVTEGRGFACLDDSKEGGLDLVTMVNDCIAHWPGGVPESPHPAWLKENPPPVEEDEFVTPRRKGRCGRPTQWDRVLLFCIILGRLRERVPKGHSYEIYALIGALASATRDDADEAKGYTSNCVKVMRSRAILKVILLPPTLGRVRR